MVSEFIPQPFPSERWLADADVLGLLYRLHHSQTVSVAGVQWFTPVWDGVTTEEALSHFANDAAANLRLMLTALQEEAQPLFAPDHWISGDPNPMNWGLREDGGIVLFDWERFGFGTAPLDLAITIPGMGDAQAFQATAAVYLASEEPSPAEISGLAKRIALAKVWNVVEFLSMTRRGQVGDPRIVPRLLDLFPDWLVKVTDF